VPDFQADALNAARGDTLKIRGALSAAAAAITIAAGVATVPVTAAAASTGPRAGQPAHVPSTARSRTVSLHAEFQRLSGHVTSGIRLGIVPPRRQHAAVRATSVRPLAATALAAPAAVSTCTEPNCNLVWNGGTVEHNPKVYVVFWGPGWSSDTGEKAAHDYLVSFYQGLGTSSDTWSTITSQYADNGGSPLFSGPVFGGSMIDTATPPSSVTGNNLATEAASAAVAFGLPLSSDDQVVVASQSGTCFNDGFAGTCTPLAQQQYCGWHSAANFNGNSGLVSFTNLPYQPDAGFSCGESWVNSGAAGTFDGFSTVGGHEYAEAVTDPFPNSGWVDTKDNVSGGENGDKCAWGGSLWHSSDPAGNVTLSTGTFAMQSLWDNASGSCIMSSASAPPPPPATSVTTGQLSGGGHAGASISVRTGTAVTAAATLSGTNAASATGMVSYFVYSDNACSNLVASSLNQQITTAGTLPVSHPVTLSKAGTYHWAVSYAGDSGNGSSASGCGGANGVETVTAPPVVKPAVNATASAVGKSSAAAAVTTTVSGDLLVAYVAGRGPSGKAQSATVTASGLKWTLVARSDAGRGDAEVWAARASGKLSKLKVTATEKYLGWPAAITVVAYQNAHGVGPHVVKHASSGAPSASLTTNAVNSWVSAVGDDWAKAAARTVGPGQRILHQVTDSSGDTYWVQSTNAITAKSGTRVTINDTRPTADPYNLVLVAIR
jgi:serine protease